MHCFRADGSVQYPTIGYAPISLARVTPFIGIPLVYAAAYQIAYARFITLPRFPYTHTDATAQPLVYLLGLASHVGQTVVFRPPPQILPQGIFAPGIPHPIASRSNGFEAAAQFGFGLLMQSKATLAAADIEAVAEEFESADIGDFGLLAIDL